MRAGVPDLRATTATLDVILEARRVRADGGPRALMIPSAIDMRTAAARELPVALEAFGEPVGPPVAARTSIADSFAVGIAVAEWAPSSPAAKEIAELVDAIEKRRRKDGDQSKEAR